MTLNEIRSHSPCQEGWVKLLKHLGKTRPDDEPLHLSTVLTSNGLDDAVWCLRTEPTPERIQRFALTVARRVQHLHPQAKATLDIVERYLSGQATRVELIAARVTARVTARVAARAAARAAADAAAYAAAAADAAAAAADAAAAYAGYAAAYAAARYAAAAAANAGYYAAEREAQAQIFREIFA